ncbi:hypothetical protein C1O66_15280 [Paucibacter aquatile]|uniref:Prepilin-type cleavage/methylation domain-containing protein n=1 Tax=Kinneretia aquatilis TaxID=2070761 RepID=A0A2N8KZ70_9BURK|nr:prepilin-type N-terminal cleavage/methylation domain-containing protein [Paucibacter aquatile]PND38749.1 hypothetical protein C1O66_15280 [Paucibacter aquatile]
MDIVRASSDGFTLVELLIGILIIGVLAAVAVPIYRDYVDRARISEAVTMVQPVFLAASEMCVINALGSATSAQLGTDAPAVFATEKVVASISTTDVSNDGLLVTVVFKSFGGVSAGSTLVYKGVCTNRSMNWSVDPTSTLPTKLLPKQA